MDEQNATGELLLANSKDFEEDGRPGTSGNFNSKRIQQKISGSKNNRLQINSPDNNADFKSQNFFSKDIDSRNYSANSAGFRPVTIPVNQSRAFRELGFAPATSQSTRSHKYQGAQRVTVTSSQNQRNGQFNMNGSGMKCVDDVRLMPKNILYDKEKLYEDLMKQKLLINGLKGENYKLKTKVLSLEEELTKAGVKQGFDYLEINQSSPFLGNNNTKGLNSVKNLGGQYINKTYSQQESTLSLAFNLKKQIQQLQEDNAKKDKDLNAIKKTIKMTQTLELEAQIKEYQGECLRLRRMLDQYMRINQEYPECIESEQDKFLIQAQQITQLKNDNVTMMQRVRSSQEELTLETQKSRDLTNNLRSAVAELKNARRLLIEREKEIDKFKGNDPFLNGGKKQGNNQTNEAGLKQENEQLVQQINDLQSQITMKNRIVSDYEKKFKDKELELQDRIQIEIKEKQQLQHKMEKDQRELEDLRKQIKERPQNTHNNIDLQYEDKQHDKKENMQPSAAQLSISQLDLNSKRRLPKVNLQDVQLYGQEIKYRLMLIGKQPNEGQSLLLDDMRGENVSILQMKQRLQQAPFLQGEEQAILIGRYLVEDNKEQFVEFDINQTNNKSFVKSVFKNLIGSYELKPNKETKEIHLKLADSLTRLKGAMLDYFQRLKGKSDSTTKKCERSLFDECWKNIDQTFSKDELNYMMMKLYSTTGNINFVDLDKFFQIFDHYGPKEVPFVEQVQPEVQEDVHLQTQEQEGVEYRQTTQDQQNYNDDEGFEQ